MVGTAGIWWAPDARTTAGDVAGYAVERADTGDSYKEIGRVDASVKEFVDPHGISDQKTLIKYRVRAFGKDGSYSGWSKTAYASNSAEILIGGDFEGGTEGYPDPWPYPFAAQTNAINRVFVVDGGYPDGKRLKVAGDESAPIIRLHSRYYKVCPGTDYLVEGWVKTEPGAVGMIGGQVLTPSMGRCEEMRIDYFQYTIAREEAGWKLLKGWDGNVPKDAAWLLVWGVCWETRGVTYFDGLRIVDKKIARIAKINPGKLISEVESAVGGLSGYQELKDKAAKLAGELNLSRDALKKTQGADVDDYMQKVARFDVLEQELYNLKLDIQLLSLKEAR